MQLIPDDILAHYEAALKTRAVPVSRHAEYRKWLRYYLDFRSKYPFPDSKSGQVRAFIDKLREKNQSHEQQQQAAHAVSLFFESQRQKKHVSPSQAEAITPTAPSLLDRQRSQPVLETKSATPQQADIPPPRDGDHQAPDPQSLSQSPVPRVAAGKRYNEWRCLEKSGSPDWDTIIDSLAAEITTRHYSRKTLKAYAEWCRKFQGFLRNKSPDELSSVDVKSYITHLAVTCTVSASTQNQAFNALLFVYRHILKKNFGDHKDIPRAKKSTYIPVVLSRKEIDAVVKHLMPPYDLAAKLLYGCGLRLFECVTLRVKNFNFDAGILTVHGKGSKDRTVPIPQKISAELMAQLEAAKTLHDEDLAAGYAGVFLEDRLEKKYPRAAKGFIWQWFFPQQSLTFVEETKERRRYHLHDTHV